MAENVIPREGASVKILVADDSKLQRVLLDELLVAQGYQVILAKNGMEAVEAFTRETPDMVLMDIIMPVMDGIQAARKIRDLIGTELYIPIVFVTEADSGRYLEECVVVGGDDFIPKPVNSTMLNAKIRSLLRVKQYCQQQADQQQLLLSYQHQVEREQEVAANLYERLIQSGFMECPNLKFLTSAMTSFNGDVLLSARTPSGSQNTLLGDFTGHGLVASIGVGPTAEVFYGMTAKGFGIREIALEINRKLHEKLPVDMFFGACFLSLDALSHRLEVCTGGLPDHYLYNAGSGDVQVVTSNNLPLGIVKSERMALSLYQFDVSADDRFYVFSDGVIETENSQGQQFGADGVLSCLKTPLAGESTNFDSILESLERFSAGRAQTDDITLVELSCDASLLGSTGQFQHVGSEEIVPSHWKLMVEFDADTLRQVNPVPTILQGIMEFQALKKFREPVFMIISELFANALEHGLLGLDSGIKKEPDGIARYFEMKEKRLAALKKGHISVQVLHRPAENGGELVVTVADSGPGFNSSGPGDRNTARNEDQGIGLIQKICRSVEFLGRGNRVRAVYEWPETGAQ